MLHFLRVDLGERVHVHQDSIELADEMIEAIIVNYLKGKEAQEIAAVLKAEQTRRALLGKPLAVKGTTLDGKEHKLLVRMNKPGMTARARRTYIASPERLTESR